MGVNKNAGKFQLSAIDFSLGSVCVLEKEVFF